MGMPPAPANSTGTDTIAPPRLRCTTKCRCGPVLNPVLPESARYSPRATRCPGTTRIEFQLRCAYSDIVPSSCNTRTMFAFGPSASRSVPFSKKSLATSMTTPSRAANTCVPTGITKSIACSLAGSPCVSLSGNACDTIAVVDSAYGNRYGCDGRCSAPGSPGKNWNSVSNRRSAVGVALPTSTSGTLAARRQDFEALERRACRDVLRLREAERELNRRIERVLGDQPDAIPRRLLKQPNLGRLEPPCERDLSVRLIGTGLPIGEHPHAIRIAILEQALRIRGRRPEQHERGRQRKDAGDCGNSGAHGYVV